jgi:hypothetical protein
MEEEGQPIEFVPGPHHGAHSLFLFWPLILSVARSMVLGLGRRRRH